MLHLWKCLPLLLISMLTGERARDRNTSVDWAERKKGGRGGRSTDDVDVGDIIGDHDGMLQTLVPRFLSGGICSLLAGAAAPAPP